MSVEADLANTATHQCEFARGYWMGMAKAYAGFMPDSTFSLRIPAAYVDDLREVLSAAQIQMGDPIRNHFGVPFVDVLIDT